MFIKKLYSKKALKSYKLIALFFVFFTMTVSINAQTNQLKTELDKEDKDYKMTAELSQTSNLRQTDDPNALSTTTLTVTPAMKLTNLLDLSLAATVTQEQTSGTETSFNNGKLSLVLKPQDITLDTKLSGKAGVTLPTNYISRKEDSFRFALNLGSSLTSKFNPFGYLVSATAGATLTNNFHRYERNNERDANAQYSLAAPISVEREIIKNLTLNLGTKYTYSRTYQGTDKSKFSFNQTLTYKWNDKLSASIGHDNDADAYKANGRDTNFSFVSERDSVYSVGLTYNL